MQRVKARAPASFKAQVMDTEKRVNLLFDHLNSETLPSDAVSGLQNIATAMESRKHEEAGKLVTELMTLVDNGQAWLVSYQNVTMQN
jgi:protein transport protein SEC31